MSATGYTPISLYYSSTAAAVPLAANLVAGELALNTTDGKLYFKNNSNVVTLLASSTGAAGTFSSITNTGLTSGRVVYSTTGGLETDSANLLFDGTTLTAAGLAGPFNGTVGATTANTGSFTSLAYSTTLTGGTGIVNLGSGQFYKDASGNVGIGTSSPVDLLQVNRSSGSGVTSGISLTTAAGAIGDGNYIKWTGATAGEKIARIDGVMEGTDTGSIRFNTGNGSDGFSERVRIDSSGNVGIGTTLPSKKLEVYAAANSLQIESIVRNDQAGTGIAAIGFNVSSTSSGETTSTKAGIGLVRGAAFGVGSLVFYNNGTSSAGDFTTADEKMRIDTSGNVGIGTSSPSASAILDAQSTTKGVRMPNMTTTQKNAISSPAAGLMVFDTTLSKLCVYSGSAWQTITSV